MFKLVEHGQGWKFILSHPLNNKKLEINNKSWCMANWTDFIWDVMWEIKKLINVSLDIKKGCVY